MFHCTLLTPCCQHPVWMHPWLQIGAGAPVCASLYYSDSGCTPHLNRPRYHLDVDVVRVWMNSASAGDVRGPLRPEEPVCRISAIFSLNLTVLLSSSTVPVPRLFCMSLASVVSECVCLSSGCCRCCCCWCCCDIPIAFRFPSPTS